MSVPIAPNVEGLAAHKHCEACGNSIGLEGRVCSKACQDKWDQGQRMKKRSLLMILGMVVLVLTMDYWAPLLSKALG